MTDRFVVTFFDKGTEKLVETSPLSSKIGIEELRKVFGLAPDNPMYDCYRVDEEAASALAPFISVALDPEKFDCFVELEGE